MGEEFEGDLSESVFWGVDLQRAAFRDVNLSGTTMKNVWLVDVQIDGLVDRLVINGVDVTEYVHEHDPWQPLRGMLRPTDPEGLRATWHELGRVWDETLAGATTAELREQSVDGEWSLIQTLRHLVFAIDKWFTVPLAGGTFSPIGLPNSGSVDFPWPGVDVTLSPSFEEVIATRADRWAQLGTYLGGIRVADFDRQIDIMENGTVPLIECLYTVFEEEFEHRRYALRDLAKLGV